MFLTLGIVRSNISIIKILPGYWDYINRAFRNEIYVTVMFKVPQWFLSSIHFGELYRTIPALTAYAHGWKLYLSGLTLFVLITKLLDEY